MQGLPGGLAPVADRNKEAAGPEDPPLPGSSGYREADGAPPPALNSRRVRSPSPSVSYRSKTRRDHRHSSGLRMPSRFVSRLSKLTVLLSADETLVNSATLSEPSRLRSARRK